MFSYKEEENSYHDRREHTQHEQIANWKNNNHFINSRRIQTALNDCREERKMFAMAKLLHYHAHEHRSGASIKAHFTCETIAQHTSYERIS